MWINSDDIYDYNEIDFFNFDDDCDKSQSNFEIEQNGCAVITCTCGAHKTYGFECPPSYHYQWCDLKRRK